MEGPPIHELIRRAQTGDQRAMEQLLTLVRPHLERVAADFADPDDAAQSASDIVQESSLRVWKHLHQFAGGGDDVQALALFRAWTGEIVRNSGREAKRRRVARKRGSGRRLVRLGPAGTGASSSTTRSPDVAASGPSPSGPLRNEERARQVETALAGIPEADVREVLRLRFFAGLNLRQVANQLGLTYEQARERYHGGLRRLGGKLKHLESE
jgi:RNA polymerase sigma factor (sigma-70 family)